MVLEKGLPMATLWQLCTSLAQAAREAGVTVVTGDTKVVERNKGDGIHHHQRHRPPARQPAAERRTCAVE